jgi:hypothetical protein
MGKATGWVNATTIPFGGWPKRPYEEAESLPAQP